jgi:hypothetical protein
MSHRVVFLVNVRQKIETEDLNTTEESTFILKEQVNILPYHKNQS